MGRITKRGDPYLRRLLVIGAMLPGKPYRLVTVALANKMARIVWAVLVGGQPYRPMAAAA